MGTSGTLGPGSFGRDDARGLPGRQTAPWRINTVNRMRRNAGIEICRKSSNRNRQLCWQQTVAVCSRMPQQGSLDSHVLAIGRYSRY